MRTTALVAGLFALAAGPLRAADGRDFFTSRVRPILARHCFKCHGPDDKARKAKIRLDLRTEALKTAASGAIPIAPGTGPPPQVPRTGWSRNAIDDFILARLKAEGLQPSGQADRPTLIRRVS